MLFDTHDDPVDDKKRKRSPARPVVEEAAAAVEPFWARPAVQPVSLGQIEDVFTCADESCGSGLHEIIDERAGAWSLLCMFCGTGQSVKAIRGYLKPKEDEFVFQTGDYAGLPISSVAADPRGLAYIEWAAEEHKSQPVKDACKKYLDAVRPAS